uniref:Scv136-like protein n=1 Tax=Trachysalambria curvirostris nimavirus TaxID=2984282 RepID=A0A9C7C992_9VIRU|nr:MAG: scv136-like protein [Trachysalambria curvirostris nimavirus]
MQDSNPNKIMYRYKIIIKMASHSTVMYSVNPRVYTDEMDRSSLQSIHNSHPVSMWPTTDENPRFSSESVRTGDRLGTKSKKGKNIRNRLQPESNQPRVRRNNTSTEEEYVPRTKLFYSIPIYKPTKVGSLSCSHAKIKQQIEESVRTGDRLGTKNKKGKNKRNRPQSESKRPRVRRNNTSAEEEYVPRTELFYSIPIYKPTKVGSLSCSHAKIKQQIEESVRTGDRLGTKNKKGKNKRNRPQSESKRPRVRRNNTSAEEGYVPRTELSCSIPIYKPTEIGSLSCSHDTIEQQMAGYVPEPICTYNNKHSRINQYVPGSLTRENPLPRGKTIPKIGNKVSGCNSVPHSTILVSAGAPRYVYLANNELHTNIATVETECSRYTASVNDTLKICRLMSCFGFVIVKGILTQKQCNDINSGVWGCMESITANLDLPVDRNNPRTWHSIRLQRHSRDVYCHHGIAHAEFLWTLRQNPRILSVFASLYKCPPEELLASFDGVSMQTSPESNRNQNDGWHETCRYRFEHSIVPANRQSYYRSWITARDIRPGDYSNSIFVGSHRINSKFSEDGSGAPQGIHFYEKRCKHIRITCSAGSLVVWDSRLLHSDLAPLRGRKRPNHRVACLLSYYPRTGMPENLMEHRVLLFRARKPDQGLDDDKMPLPVSEKLVDLKHRLIETAELRYLVGYRPSVLTSSPYNRMTTYDSRNCYS